MKRIKVYRQIVGTLREWYEVDEVTPEILDKIANEELTCCDSELLLDTIESFGAYEICDDRGNIIVSTYE